VDEQRIEDWISTRRLRTGKIELTDYDFEKPSTNLRSQAKGTENYSHSNLEMYDYPGNYKKTSIGDHYAKIELEAQQALDHRRQGSGDAISLFPGGLTTLKGHPATESQDKQYLIVRSMHAFSDQNYRSGDDQAAKYNGHYEFLPRDQQFRAPLVTPRPRIYGIQTAVVVGGAGEEIDVDKYGRIYVQFHWDRQGKRDQNSSCRIRVAQVWSGKNWGGQFIPRIGQEAVVEFLEGDPDHPLVVGTVYNAEYMHPYDLPGQKTVSGIKSDKTKGSKGYNEWSFDDKKDSEKITIHAEKDHDVTVKHAETWQIGEKFEAPTGMPSRKVEIKKGDDALKIASGSRKVDTAMMDQLKAGCLIKLECGGSKITMAPGVLIIESPMIIINGSLVMIN
jgi:type VI secretion system secreted protein VgrG